MTLPQQEGQSASKKERMITGFITATGELRKCPRFDPNVHVDPYPHGPVKESDLTD